MLMHGHYFAAIDAAVFDLHCSPLLVRADWLSSMSAWKHLQSQ